MSPTAIEGLLVEHRLIGQALAFGGRQPLPTLDGEVAPTWARARGIEARSLAELARPPRGDRGGGGGGRRGEQAARPSSGGETLGATAG